ncbi:MAG: hypothetical protein M1379_00550 [Firmicutes bacterium]|nr:hypothetical protein [Bacillota bacterium]
MDASYTLGVGAAVAAGIAFNLGLVLQKAAVMHAGKGTGLMRRLVRSPLWVTGFTVQFLVGMPLNMLAQAHIGPAMIPGLMSMGLVVLAFGAVRFARESLGPPDISGMLLVMGAVALFGFSGLGIDVKALDLHKPVFLIRLAVFSAGTAFMTVACYVLQRGIARWRGVLRILNAGLLFVQSNLWLGVLMGALARWSARGFAGRELLLLGTASVITFAGSMLGITETQRAFQAGDAAKLVPIQYVPQQIMPVISYFAVFGLMPRSRVALFLAVTAAGLILAGSALLARRQALLAD